MANTGVRQRQNDLTGKNIGFLHVDKAVPGGKYECTCVCGSKCIKRQWDLENRENPSCGCMSGKKGSKVKIGDIYGDWEVIDTGSDSKHSLCRCSCGEIREVLNRSITSGRSTGCGHRTSAKKTSPGEVINNVKFVEYIGDGKWVLECKCGNKFIAKATDVRSGNTTSCGCARHTNKVIDLTGKHFGDWVAIRYVGNSYWKCECSCGNIKNVHSYTLRNGLSTNCGSALHRYKDITGNTYGELTVQNYVGSGFWRCKCLCGNIVALLGCNLRNGSTRSCGCKTDMFMRNTLLKRYGDYCPSRANNPRSSDAIEMLNDKQLFVELLNMLNSKYKRQPTLSELAEYLDVHTSTVARYATEYEITNMINMHLYASKSHYEDEILALFPGAIHGDKTVLNGKELDLYYKNEKVAIEFNGSYWHSTLYKDKDYHKNKTIACKEKGIRLIHVFEYEWIDKEKREKIINIIANALGRNIKSTIYARNTVVKLVNDIEIQKSFLEKYHLQGYVNSTVAVGCYYNDELVGIMTFGKSRFNAAYDVELLRLAWKKDTYVVGGIEKMFQYFRQYCGNNIKSIVSYCDISKFTGKSYEKLGFKLITKTIQPSYVWVDLKSNTVLSRYQTQKQRLIELGLGTENQTEVEIMENNGWLQVFNCGNAVYVYNKQ